MTNTYEIRVNGDGVEQVVIPNADGGFTVMDKDYYEAQQVEHLTEIPPQAALSTPMVTEE